MASQNARALGSPEIGYMRPSLEFGDQIRARRPSVASSEQSWEGVGQLELDNFKGIDSDDEDGSNDIDFDAPADCMEDMRPPLPKKASISVALENLILSDTAERETKRKAKRVKVIEELIVTEEHYLRDLEIMIARFKVMNMTFVLFTFIS